jgi:hypothetical protein
MGLSTRGIDLLNVLLMVREGRTKLKLRSQPESEADYFH